jgi:hypothetical protein
VDERGKKFLRNILHSPSGLKKEAKNFPETFSIFLQGGRKRQKIPPKHSPFSFRVEERGKKFLRNLLHSPTGWKKEAKNSSGTFSIHFQGGRQRQKIPPKPSPFTFRVEERGNKNASETYKNIPVEFVFISYSLYRR